MGLVNVGVGAVVSFLGILALVGVIHLVVRKKGLKLRTILVESQGYYSLTKFQILSWTFVFIFSIVWVYLVRIQGGVLTNLQTLPVNTLALMGINTASAVGSSAIPLQDTSDKDDDWRRWKGSFWSILVSDNPNQVDLARVQFFVWTLVSIGIYICLLFSIMLSHTVLGPSASLSTLSIPDVDPSLVTLMGLSHGAYVGTKYIIRRKDSVSSVDGS